MTDDGLSTRRQSRSWRPVFTSEHPCQAVHSLSHAAFLSLEIDPKGKKGDGSKQKPLHTDTPPKVPGSTSAAGSHSRQGLEQAVGRGCTQDRNAPEQGSCATVPATGSGEQREGACWKQGVQLGQGRC